ncbi:MAG: TonB-dependent receptor domain-containing protein, partial [Gammaproteobacteria bacterium]
RRVDQDTARVGMHLAPSLRSDFIASVIYSDRDGNVKTTFADFGVDASRNLEGHDVQGQYLFRDDGFNLVFGAGTYEFDVDSVFAFSGIPLPPVVTRPTIDQENVYAYANLRILDRLTGTLGASYDVYDDETIDESELNPKLGLQWNITDRALLRAAAFETLKRELVVDQAIEPTHVAGFNQFFDDLNGTKTRLYGTGLDVTILDTLYGGIEGIRRDLDVPIASGGSAVFQDRDESLLRAYLYWALSPSWALTAEHRFEKVESEFPATTVTTLPVEIQTHTAPVMARYFGPGGIFAEVATTFVWQEVDLINPRPGFNETSERFAVVDAAIGYRLPKRRGIISLEGRNIFDEDFIFQDRNFTSDPTSNRPPFIPERTILGRITFVF